jgi:hypothetical protein
MYFMNYDWNDLTYTFPRPLAAATDLDNKRETAARDRVSGLGKKHRQWWNLVPRTEGD